MKYNEERKNHRFIVFANGTNIKKDHPGSVIATTANEVAQMGMSNTTVINLPGVNSYNVDTDGPKKKVSTPGRHGWRDEIHFVGTKKYNSAFAYGHGEEDNIEAVLKQLREKFKSDSDQKIDVDLIGYSRGAVAQIKLANLVYAEFGDKVNIRLSLVDPAAGPMRHRSALKRVLPPNVSVVNLYYAEKNHGRVLKTIPAAAFTTTNAQTKVNVQKIKNTNHVPADVSHAKEPNKNASNVWKRMKLEQYEFLSLQNDDITALEDKEKVLENVTDKDAAYNPQKTFQNEDIESLIEAIKDIDNYINIESGQKSALRASAWKFACELINENSNNERHHDKQSGSYIHNKKRIAYTARLAKKVLLKVEPSHHNDFKALLQRSRNDLRREWSGHAVARAGMKFLGVVGGFILTPLAALGSAAVAGKELLTGNVKGAGSTLFGIATDKSPIAIGYQLGKQGFFKKNFSDHLTQKASDQFFKDVEEIISSSPSKKS